MKQLHVGLTGLSRAGKTVLLTSAVYHLLELTGDHLGEFEMHGWKYHGTRGQLRKSANPFAYKEKLKALQADPPSWPEPTIDVSEFPVHLRLVNADETRRECQINFLDYPGERLLDVALLETTYEEWCNDMDDRFASAEGEYKAAVNDWQSHFDSLVADRKDFPKSRLRSAQQMFGNVCAAAHAAGMPIAPVMPVLEADGGGQVVAPFFPLTPDQRRKFPELATQMKARLDRYIRRSAKPFLKQIGTCQHQVVLVDILGILEGGLTRYINDREQMHRILNCYRAINQGWARFFSRTPIGTGIKRVTFCATKADTALEPDRENMVLLLKELFNKARTGLEYDHKTLKGFDFLALGAFRGTEDVTSNTGSQPTPALKGILPDTGQVATFTPSRVPSTFPAKKEGWTDFDFPDVLPRKSSDLPDQPLPQLNLDRLLFEILEGVI